MNTTQRTRRTNKLLAERVSSFHTVSSLRADQLGSGYVPTIHDREVAQLLVNEGIKVYFPKGRILRTEGMQTHSMIVADLTLDGVIFKSIREGGGQAFTARDIVELLNELGDAGIAHSLPKTADVEYWASAKRIASRSACRFDRDDIAYAREHLVITERLKGLVRAGVIERHSTRRVECTEGTSDTTTTETVYAI